MLPDFLNGPPQPSDTRQLTERERQTTACDLDLSNRAFAIVLAVIIISIATIVLALR